MSEIRNKKGLIFFCPVCGAEITVICDGKGHLGPMCCNMKMVAKGSVTTFFSCARCGAEVMILTLGVGNTTPKCCNEYMERVDL